MWRRHFAYAGPQSWVNEGVPLGARDRDYWIVGIHLHQDAAQGVLLLLRPVM